VGVPEVGERLYNTEWQEGIPCKFLSDPAKLVRLKAGDELTFSSGLKIEVLAPVTVIGGTEADANNNSLVMLLHCLGKKVLLTGDMEIDEMEEITDRGAKWDADFIKVPHHGGKSSFNPLWFDQTSPAAVFISVGSNSFGHPTNEVLNYWQERGIPTYRTDIHGTITLVVERESYRIIEGRKN
jgi:competence protein ComEC